MTKKRSSLPAPKGSDLPYLMKASADVWHEVVVHLSTLEHEEDGGGPEEKWERYVCKMTLSDEDDEESDEEVPFWCMDGFKEVIDDAYEAGDSMVTIAFKRKVKSDGNNSIKFRLED